MSARSQWSRRRGLLFSAWAGGVAAAVAEVASGVPEGVLGLMEPERRCVHRPWGLAAGTRAARPGRRSPKAPRGHADALAPGAGTCTARPLRRAFGRCRSAKGGSGCPRPMRPSWWTAGMSPSPAAPSRSAALANRATAGADPEASGRRRLQGAFGPPPEDIPGRQCGNAPPLARQWPVHVVAAGDAGRPEGAPAKARAPLQLWRISLPRCCAVTRWRM